MKTNNQLVKYKDKPIRKWFTNIIDKIKSRFVSSKMWDKETCLLYTSPSPRD